MEDSAYQSERATAMANAVVNEIAAQSARIEARASRNADVLRDMAVSDGLELGAIYETVEAVFSTVPAANVSAGLTRKLEAMGKSKAALARACAPITKPTTIPLCTLGMESGSAPRLAGVLGIELPVPERFRG